MNAKSRLHRFRLDNSLCIWCGKNSTHTVFCYRHWLCRIYNNIKSRCGNKYNHQKSECYKHIKLVLTKDEFILWGLANRPMCINPSIERINPKKHYSIDNICWVPLSENIANANKQKDVKEGYYKCRICLKIFPRLPFYFYADKHRRGDGLRAECKKCHKEITKINRRLLRARIKANGSIKIHRRTKSRNST